MVTPITLLGLFGSGLLRVRFSFASSSRKSVSSSIWRTRICRCRSGDKHNISATNLLAELLIVLRLQAGRRRVASAVIVVVGQVRVDLQVLRAALLSAVMMLVVMAASAGDSAMFSVSMRRRRRGRHRTHAR